MLCKRVVFILSVSSILLTSCNALKRTADNDDKVADSAAIASLPDTTKFIGPPPLNGEALPAAPEIITPSTTALIEQIVPIWQYHKDFSTFKGKAKMHYEGGGQRQDFTANIRMAKDSVIWLHITAGMGLVNVARVYITPDSFQMVNFLGKSAMKMHISEAEQLLPAKIDFNQLQNFIMGEALTEPVQRVTDAADFGGTWALMIEGQQAQQNVAIKKADSTIISQEILSPAQAFAAMINYADYTVVNNLDFAVKRAININNKGEQHYIEMNFNGADFDEEMNFPFNIPDSYTLNKEIR